MLWWIKERGKAPEKFAGIMTRGEYGRDSVFLCIILAAPFIHIKLYSIILIVKINFTQFVLKEVVVFWWQCIRLRPMLARLTHLLILTFSSKKICLQVAPSYPVNGNCTRGRKYQEWHVTVRNDNSVLKSGTKKKKAYCVKFSCVHLCLDLNL